MAAANETVDILVLGAGWTSQFLVPLMKKESLRYGLTTTKGTVKDECKGIYDESKVIPFAFDAASEDEEPFRNLPTAKTVIITFPLSGKGPSKKLMETYCRTHAGENATNWIQFGSTGVYKEARLHTYQSEITSNPRSEAEDELIGLRGCVLNLAGLWGGKRLPWNWVSRIGQTKEKLKEKTSLHLIHGDDVARACVALHKKFYGGERFIVTDRHVYDWWDLIDGWAITANQDMHPYKQWVDELMREEGVGVLPRSHEALGRVLDSSKFWELMQISPMSILRTTPQPVL